MRILFLTRLYDPHVGGVEKHVKKISRLLIDKGHKVTIITEKYEDKLSDRQNIDGVKIIRITYPKIRFLGLLAIWMELWKLRNEFNKADIVHIHDIVSWCWVLKLLDPKKKFYATFHGRWGVYPVNWADKLQKKIGAKITKANICIGDYIPKYYGIKANVISYGAIEPLRKTVKSKEKELVLYVGRLDEDIALEVIFEVFAKLKDHDIHFLGDGQLLNKAKKFGEVHGFTDPNPYYKKAKFVFASGYLTIMEALLNKCLVFTAYANPLQKDYYRLSPFKEFIVSSGDENKLLKEFKFLASDQKRFNERVNAGYEWVKNQTWEKMTNNYIELWS